MGRFDDFNFENFWNDSDYAMKSAVGKPVTDSDIAAAETQLGYQLPQSYKDLLKIKNGGIFKSKWIRFEAKGYHFVIGLETLYGIDAEKLDSLLGELGNAFWQEEWGYPDIGIAIADTESAGHDMIFLDYRACGNEGEPKVVLVSQESDYEIFEVAENFETFIRMIEDAKWEEMLE